MKLLLAASILALAPARSSAQTPDPAAAANAPAVKTQLLNDIMAARTLPSPSTSPVSLDQIEGQARKADTSVKLDAARQAFEKWRNLALQSRVVRLRRAGLDNSESVRHQREKLDFLSNQLGQTGDREALAQSFAKLIDNSATRAPGNDVVPVPQPRGAITEAVRGFAANFIDLKVGRDQDPVHRRAILKIKQALNDWAPRLQLELNGDYDEELIRALTLFKTVSGTGHDGRSLVNDEKTAALLGARLQGMQAKTTGLRPYDAFTQLQRTFRPKPTPAQRTLEAALNYLGTPYEMNGDGKSTTDCGMFTRSALMDAKVVPDISRLADIQYLDASKVGMTSFLAGTAEPRPGDLVFFDHRTIQSGIAVNGITHVGIYLAHAGQHYIMAASSGHRAVVIQSLDEFNPKDIYAFARLAAN